MPQTINGIGTHYYGKADRRERPGICEFCGKPATIQSYTTRYWFVIIFIPIIPLGKKRVLDQCGRCRRHRVAKLADWEQARTKALEDGMRKVVEHQGELEPLTELHRTCLAYGEWEKADQLAARIETEFAQDAKAQLHLARAHGFRGRVQEADRLIERARQLDPTLVKEAEEQAKASAPKPPRKLRQRILLAVLGALVLGGVLLADWHQGHFRTLHVVNGYGIPLQVRIAGFPELPVAPLSERSMELPEGTRSAHVTGPLTADLPFEISSFFLARLFDSRVFVLNPGGAGLLIQEDTLYSSDHTGSAAYVSPFKLRYGKPFETFDDIDFVFSPFPAKISMDKTGSVHKHRLGLIHTPVADLVRNLMRVNRQTDALALAEWAIDAHPSKGEVVQAYADAAATPACRDRVLGGLKSRLGRRPVEIPLHRMYQNLSTEGPQTALAAEYDALLAADPGNSALLYLRGRLEPGIAATTSYCDRAIAADPSNAFAQAALAYSRTCQGRWTDALPPAVRACELDPENTGFETILEDIRIALGQFDPLEKDLRARCLREGYAPTPALVNLINLLAFRKDREGAIRLCDCVRQPRPGEDDKSRNALATELQCRAFYAGGDLAALALEIDKADKAHPSPHRFAVLIEQGHLEEADALAEKENLGAFETLARSIAWSLQGNTTQAEALRQKGAELLQKAENRQMHAAASLFQPGKAPANPALLDLDLHPPLKAIVLTALAQAYPESGPDLIRQARAVNKALSFPRHLLDRALAALEKHP